MKKTTRNLLVITLALIIVLSALALISCRKNERYTVTFNSNGGSVVNSITDVERNAKIVEPASPTRAGYTFAGWFSDRGLNTLWKFDSDKVKGNMTLYAKWTYNATNGLRLVINDKGTAYSVAGMGNVTEQNLVIPDKYNNLPVTVIMVGAFSNVDTITSVYVPSGIVTVGSSAFSGCANLETVVFGGEADLGVSVFKNCVKLQKVVLPNNLTEIKDETFSTCNKLQEVNIPDTVTSIGNEAFYYCEKLPTVNLPVGLTKLGDKAFAGCTSFTSVNLPAHVTSLGENVFAGCRNISALTVETGNSVYYSAGNCIISRTENGTVRTVVVGCKNSVIPANVTVIGIGAFVGCSALESIDIPRGVTTIEDHAFESCSGLKSILIPATVTKVGDYAFSGCEYLAKVDFGSNNDVSNLESIGREAFSYCKMTGFKIPHSVTFLGAGVFYNNMTGSLTVSYVGTVEEWKNNVTVGEVGENEEDKYKKPLPISCNNNRTTSVYGIA